MKGRASYRYGTQKVQDEGKRNIRNRGPYFPGCQWKRRRIKKAFHQGCDGFAGGQDLGELLVGDF